MIIFSKIKKISFSNVYFPVESNPEMNFRTLERIWSYLCSKVPQSSSKAMTSSSGQEIRRDSASPRVISASKDDKVSMMISNI